MSALLTSEEIRQVNFLLGPWLIGSCIDLLLQGILLSQFVNYFSYYADDKRILKIAVSILCVLTILKSIQAFSVIWIIFIDYFGDVQGGILLNYITWWQSGTPLMVAIIGLFVQSYFCYRLWVISKKRYAVASMGALFFFAFHRNRGTHFPKHTYFITTADGVKIGQWFAAHLGATSSGDIILSVTTAYFLLKSKKDVLPQTVGLISALVHLTFQTAAPAAICAMFKLVFSQIYTGNQAIISTGFNMALPTLYAISMMWTLNARRIIRATHGSRPGMTASSNELSGARARARRPNGDVKFGQIQVVTQTEHHVDDVRVMFDPSQKQYNQVDTKRSDDYSVQDTK
ncbi:hypothetical protein DFH06DRAFT_1323120 [Mycena polygramma]|nr:hypothetical protein DFH06DRAFT_1323120 [Mycena polygramma]